MLEKREIWCSAAGENRMLHIWLPDTYYNNEERYPVMYFFDGQNLFLDSDATYGKSWGLAEFMRRWEKPMILVGIECGHAEGQRMVEYCPYSIHSSWLGSIDGTGDATLRWMADYLKPYIDHSFRTWSHREATGIGGSSMGGIMSLYAGVRYNKVFSKAACVSTALSGSEALLAGDIMRCGISADSRFYLSWGTEELTGRGRGDNWRETVSRVNGDVCYRLTAKGALVRLRCQEGGHHCEADWEKLLPECMNYLWCGK